MMLRDYSEDVNHDWKLKAIDSLGVAIDDKVSREERTKIIDLMIGSSHGLLMMYD